MDTAKRVFISDRLFIKQWAYIKRWCGTEAHKEMFMFFKDFSENVILRRIKYVEENNIKGEWIWQAQ